MSALRKCLWSFRRLLFPIRYSSVASPVFSEIWSVYFL